MWTITYLVDGKVNKFKVLTDCKYEAIEKFKSFISNTYLMHENIRMCSCLEDSRTTSFGAML